MDIYKFKLEASEVQKTVKIGQNPELKRKYYELFDDFYLFLESKRWDKSVLIERGEYSGEAFFQNIAEAYYRLGFFEVTFYYFSKLIYELWYQKVIEYQTKNDERIHKGTQVHQIGIIFDLLSQKNLAWDYYLSGLIEDLISGRSLEKSQAFRMLRVLGMPRAEIENFQRLVSRKEIIFDPLLFVEELRATEILSTYDEIESIDYNKLKQAEILWKRVKKKREEGKSGKLR